MAIESSWIFPLNHGGSFQFVMGQFTRPGTMLPYDTGYGIGGIPAVRLCKTRLL